MKLSILIFVLAAIIYQCQCDGMDEIDRDMENLRKRLNIVTEKTSTELPTAKPQNGKTTNYNQKGYKGITTFTFGNFFASTHWKTVDGNPVEETVEDRKFDNDKLRTIIERTPALNRTEVNFYRCNLPDNSKCFHISGQVMENNRWL